ncbi:MAG: outer rane beta-barrel protein [Mucilaginibacter sp.]|nr:outer rane beta-barrel protein [Mucilaginibacter sp.]
MPKFVSFFLLLFISFNLQAQTWELGGFAGGSAYMGDLNPNNPVKISGVALGAFVKRNFDGYLSLKLNYTFGQISGADNTSSNPQFRQRNLSFSTNLNELSVIGEFNFMKYIPEAGENRYTPFVYLGLGVVGYNPQASYQGHTYNLRPLMTEGESKPYPNTAISVPYGVGFKYNFSGKWNLIADIGYRNPTTDYLDDVSGLYANKSKLPSDPSRALSDRSGENTGVYTGSPGSQRGDQRPKDTYMFVGFSISFTFVTSKCYY